MLRRTLLLLSILTLAACDIVQLEFVTPSPISGPATVAAGSGGAAATPAPANDWYRLYFTNPADRDDPDNRPADSIDDYVIASINAATHTVDAATFDFNLPSMAEAFIAAHQRGVVVRLVTDTDSMSEDVVKEIQAAGVPVVEDKRSAIMHHKFVIVDGLVVWTGSWNFSENDTYRNNNNVIGIASPDMVANYQTVFNRMFEQKEFGPASATNPFPEFAVGGTQIENYFSPGGNVYIHVLSALNNARQSIYFAAFTFTREDFAEAIVERARTGVTVRGVFETRQIEAGADQAYRKMKNADLTVLTDGNRYTMHHKFFVIDEQIVITGSYNFSAAADDSNNENLLIIYSADIARQFKAEFDKVYAKAEAGQ